MSIIHNIYHTKISILKSCKVILYKYLSKKRLKKSVVPDVYRLTGMWSFNKTRGKFSCGGGYFSSHRVDLYLELTPTIYVRRPAAWSHVDITVKRPARSFGKIHHPWQMQVQLCISHLVK